MKMRDFLKQCLSHFFVVVTCIVAVYATLGKALYPDDVFGFEAFYSPLVIGLISMLPTFILYSRNELSFRKTLIRKGLHLLAVEGILVLYGVVFDGFSDRADLWYFMLAVLLVYTAANFIGLWLDSRDTHKINQKLKELQERK